MGKRERMYEVTVRTRQGRKFDVEVWCACSSPGCLTKAARRELDVIGVREGDIVTGSIKLEGVNTRALWSPRDKAWNFSG